MTFYHYPVAVEGEWVFIPLGGSTPPCPTGTCFESIDENNLLGNTTNYSTTRMIPGNLPSCGCATCGGDMRRTIYLDFGQLVNLDSAIAGKVEFECLSGAYAFDRWDIRMSKAETGENFSDPTTISAWWSLTPSLVTTLSPPPLGFTTYNGTYAAGHNTRWLKIEISIYAFPPPLTPHSEIYNLRSIVLYSETTPPLPPVVAGPRLWIYKSTDNGISWTSRGVMVA